MSKKIQNIKVSSKKGRINRTRSFRGNEIFIQWIVPIFTLCIAIGTFALSCFNSYISNHVKSPLFIQKLVVSKQGDDALEEFIYTIQSKNEFDRYQVVEFLPMLYIYVEENDQIISESFVDLNSMYWKKDVASESTVFAFSEFESNFDATYKLKTAYYNRDKSKKNMNSKIVYKVIVEYLDKLNRTKTTNFMISRQQENLIFGEENTLFIDHNLYSRYEKAERNHQIYFIQSLQQNQALIFAPSSSCLTNPVLDMIKQIEDDIAVIIHKIQKEYGMVEFAEQ